ncbi:choline binding protein A [Streptococcus pneumoniae]|nr:choline binding protein A [Streptococcus pneumoniae]
MATGWVKDGDTWYYLNANGDMATGWLQYNGSWYYLNANGDMATGWLQYNGSGALAVNTTVDGYGVNANGEWVN